MRDARLRGSDGEYLVAVREEAHRVGSHGSAVAAVVRRPARGGVGAGFKTRERSGRRAAWAALPEHSREASVAMVEILEKAFREGGCGEGFRAGDRACDGQRHGGVVGRMAGLAWIEQRAADGGEIVAHDRFAEVTLDLLARDELEGGA